MTLDVLVNVIDPLIESPADKTGSATYDELDRLTSGTDPSQAGESFGCDPAGNRLSDATISGWSYNDSNELNAYAGITLSYDDNGSRTGKLENGETTTYLYNLKNRLAEIMDHTDTTVASYYHDPFGRRLWKDVGGVRTHFSYAEEGLEAELDNSGQVIQSYGYTPQSGYGTDLLYSRAAGLYVYSQNDHLGTPQQFISKTGQKRWQGRPQAFGETTEEIALTANPIRFPGQYYDAESGLHYNYYRDYDPGVGRYVESDPIGLGGGVNAYAYALYNPLKYIDPVGLLGLYGGATLDIVGGYGFSLNGGGYYGTGGGGTFSGASANVGFEVGLDFEAGFFTGCAPPQTREDVWGFDIDAGVWGVQFNATSWSNISLGLTIGPGTPGITVNPGGPNVSF